MSRREVTPPYHIIDNRVQLIYPEILSSERFETFLKNVKSSYLLSTNGTLRSIDAIRHSSQLKRTHSLPIQR